MPWLEILVCLALALPVAARAQSGEELYTDYFGCWNCHGRRGEGGEGRPLRDTGLPISFFLKELRLPTTTMPPFSPMLATDAELAAVYGWLGGVDSVATPLPLTLELDVRAGAEIGAREIDVAPLLRDPTEADRIHFRFRLSLFRQDASLVANQAFRWQTEDGEALVASTDDYGEARLGPESGIAASSLDGSPRRPRLDLTLSPGGYVIVLEALEVAAAAGEPVVLGVATAVLEVD